MKDDFHGFYEPTSEEFDAIWKESIICVDANVLLNLYTYSQATSDEILNLLSEYVARIWLPHQVALEYHENRYGVILKEAKRYTEISNTLQTVGAALRTRKRHPYITSELASKFNELEVEISEALVGGGKKHRDLIAADVIRDKITKLFDGRVGPATTGEELESIYKEGSTRFASKIPPGYKDIKKPEPDRYGDLVLWHQMMEHATERKKPMIFVTDDLKEDWWMFAGDERVGPRPELRHEFRSKTKYDIYIYSTDGFVDKGKERGKKLSESAIEEIERASKERQQDAVDERARERLMIDSLEKYHKQQEMFERMTRDSLEKYHKQQEMFERMTRDPLEKYRKQQEMFERMTRDPLEKYRKQQEMFERMTRDPLEKEPNATGEAERSESDNDETDGTESNDEQQDGDC